MHVLKKPLMILLAVMTALTLGCSGSLSSGDSDNGLSGFSAEGSSVEGQREDAPETGLQGQVPRADMQSGRAAEGYRLGVRAVGLNTILDRGANFSMAWIGDCAYVTTASPSQLGGQASPYSDPSFNPLNGMAVIDVADPTNPILLDIIQSEAMLAPHESIQANEQRGIIVATRSGSPTFDVFDASDCRNPQFLASIQITENPLPSTGPVSPTNGYTGHALCLSHDGMTAVATSTAQLNAVIDLSDPANPQVLNTFMPAAHDCGFSPDDDRLYLALFGFVHFGIVLPGGPAVGRNGIAIYDFSDFTNRVPNPTLTEVGSIGWNNTDEDQTPSAGSHTVRWFQNGGRTYLYSSDEWPSSGNCPWAHARIIDITDETNPVEVSDIQLEVQQTINCPAVTPDGANYSAHYVGIDDIFNATTLFTTNYAAGMRVVNISDPANPVEIGYFHPAPNPNAGPVTGGNGFGSSGAEWDAMPSYVRFRPETGHIWAVGFSSGFFVLELTDTAGPMAPRTTNN